MAARLFGYFPPPDVGDPQILLSGAVKMFMNYPHGAVEAVCDPVGGYPSKSKWAPNLAELRQALDIAALPYIRALERDRQIHQQLEERKLLAGPAKPRKTYEELQAELADVGIRIGNRGATAKPTNIKEFREKYSISQEQWDAIPNAKRA